MPLPLLARQLDLLQVLLRLIVIGPEFVDSLVLPAGLEELFQLLLKRFLCLAQARQSGTGGEKQLAEMPLAGADFFSRLRQPLVVDAEKHSERFLVHSTQESRQAVVGDDRWNHPDRAACSLAPPTNELEFLAVAVPQHSTDAELLVGMDEVVGRQVRKAEEQVRQRSQRRGLACLVGAVDQVQTLFARGEIQHRRR